MRFTEKTVVVIGATGGLGAPIARAFAAEGAALALAGSPPARPRSKWGRTLGILLIVLSFLAYGVLISLPVLPLEGKLKLALAPVLVGVGEATFWIGGLFVGKDLVTRYRRYLNPCHWVCRPAGRG